MPTNSISSWIAEQYKQMFSIVQLKMQLALDQTTTITIYRILQELVGNIIRHAAAKTALVQITRSGNRPAKHG